MIQYKQGKRVTFKVGNKEYYYKVCANHLSSNSGDNSSIFTVLNLTGESSTDSKIKFVSDAIGYKAGGGACPTYKSHDYMAASRLIDALQWECDKHNSAPRSVEDCVAGDYLVSLSRNSDASRHENEVIKVGKRYGRDICYYSKSSKNYGLDINPHQKTGCSTQKYKELAYASESQILASIYADEYLLIKGDNPTKFSTNGESKDYQERRVPVQGQQERRTGNVAVSNRSGHSAVGSRQVGYETSYIRIEKETCTTKIGGSSAALTNRS